jgi:hypothetical protein
MRPSSTTPANQPDQTLLSLDREGTLDSTPYESDHIHRISGETALVDPAQFISIRFRLFLNRSRLVILESGLVSALELVLYVKADVKAPCGVAVWALLWKIFLT